VKEEEMATPNYGIDAELAAKMAGKFDPKLAGEVIQWIETIIGSKKGDQSIGDWLKDGKVLCELANKIQPGSVKKVNSSAMPFKMMENITYFTDFARSVGVPENTMFATVDLYEEKNIVSVINCLYVFGGIVQVEVPSFTGPKLGIAQAGTASTYKKEKTTAMFGAQPIDVARPKDERGVNHMVNVKGPGQGSSPVPSPRGGGGGGGGYTAPTRGSVSGGNTLEVPGAAGATGTSPRDRGASTGGYAAPKDDATYGLSAELAAAQAAKLGDPEFLALEAEVVRWVETVTGESKGGQSTQEWLKNGHTLCNLCNKVQPGSAKINKMNFAQMQRENISTFVNFARATGVPEYSAFSPDDLYEDKNMLSVVNCIYAFGGEVQKKYPSFTPKLGIAAVATNDSKRTSVGAVATDMHSGFRNTMEKTAANERADYCVKPIAR
jgi:hypothetical protein